MLVKGRWPSRLPLGDPLVGPGFLGPSYIVKVFLKENLKIQAKFDKVKENWNSAITLSEV